MPLAAQQCFFKGRKTVALKKYIVSSEIKTLVIKISVTYNYLTTSTAYQLVPQLVRNNGHTAKR
jgi:hypothetical protein